MSKVTTVNLPPRLAEQVEAYVRAGWFPDVNALITEALRQYLESHRMELMEQFVLKDVEWGLRGND